jgi:hypothetical protein
MNNTKVLPPEAAVERILAVMETGTAAPLVISGNSMSPFLVHGRDTVYLTPPPDRLKKGDMIFYRRDSGSYVLHRICAVEGDTFCLVGDCQVEKEPGIRRDQVIALVTAVRRKGKLLKKGSFLWAFFENVWIRMIPLRPAALRICGCCKRKRI